MSLPAGSRNHVRTYPLQETKRALVKAHGQAFGQSAPVLLGRFDPITQSLKTSQHSFLEQTGNGLSEFSGTYPRSGMMRNGTVYQLPNLARTTTEIGSGLFLTPQAASSQSASMEASLKEAKRLHPKGQNALAEEVATRYFPTPCSRDYKGARSIESLEAAGRNGTNSLPDAFAVSLKSARLNPQFVEALMGYPITHTDLKDSETP